MDRDLSCKDDTWELGMGRALRRGNAAMIHTVDMKPKGLNILSHMPQQPIYRWGQEVQSGSAHHRTSGRGARACSTDINMVACLGLATPARGNSTGC